MSDRPEDRRVHRRVNAKVPVKISTGDGIEGTTQDLSEGGMGVVVSSAVEKGKTLEIFIDVPHDLEGKQIKTMATVMWSAQTDSGAYVAGLKFDGPSPDSMARLRKFLDSQD